MANVPQWLKVDPFVLHAPSSTVFAPQRRIAQRNKIACLLDANDKIYPFHECQQLRLEHVTTAALITDTGTELSVWWDGGHLVITDGRRRVGLRLLDEVDAAAEAMARAFSGAIVPNGDRVLEAAEVW